MRKPSWVYLKGWLVCLSHLQGHVTEALSSLKPALAATTLSTIRRVGAQKLILCKSPRYHEPMGDAYFRALDRANRHFIVFVIC